MLRNMLFRWYLFSLTCPLVFENVFKHILLAFGNYSIIAYAKQTMRPARKWLVESVQRNQFHWYVSWVHPFHIFIWNFYFFFSFFFLLFFGFGPCCWLFHDLRLSEQADGIDIWLRPLDHLALACRTQPVK